MCVLKNGYNNFCFEGKYMKVFFVSALAFMLVFVAGCDNMNKQDAGVLIGGATGALLGSRFGGGSGQVLATVAGAVGGALIGGAIGNNMDKTDQITAMQAVKNTPNNSSASWTNPNTGYHYTVTPIKSYHNRGGRYCREYTTIATIAGKKQQVYGKACRQPDGTWKVAK